MYCFIFKYVWHILIISWLKWFKTDKCTSARVLFCSDLRTEMLDRSDAHLFLFLSLAKVGLDFDEIATNHTLEGLPKHEGEKARHSVQRKVLSERLTNLLYKCNLSQSGGVEPPHMCWDRSLKVSNGHGNGGMVRKDHRFDGQCGQHGEISLRDKEVIQSAVAEVREKKV